MQPLQCTKPASRVRWGVDFQLLPAVLPAATMSTRLLLSLNSVYFVSRVFWLPRTPTARRLLSSPCKISARITHASISLVHLYLVVTLCLCAFVCDIGTRCTLESILPHRKKIPTTNDILRYIIRENWNPGRRAGGGEHWVFHGTCMAVLLQYASSSSLKLRSVAKISEYLPRLVRSTLYPTCWPAGRSIVQGHFVSGTHTQADIHCFLTLTTVKRLSACYKNISLLASTAR